MSNIDECYANTNVLVNKLNIRDKNKLQEKEDKITGVVTQEITLKNGINDFNFNCEENLSRVTQYTCFCKELWCYF